MRGAVKGEKRFAVLA